MLCILLPYMKKMHFFSKYQTSPAMLTVTATRVIVKMEDVSASWITIIDWTAPYRDVSKGKCLF